MIPIQKQVYKLEGKHCYNEFYGSLSGEIIIDDAGFFESYITDNAFYERQKIRGRIRDFGKDIELKFFKFSPGVEYAELLYHLKKNNQEKYRKNDFSGTYKGKCDKAAKEVQTIKSSLNLALLMGDLEIKNIQPETVNLDHSLLRENACIEYKKNGELETRIELIRIR
jgi:hypothetical protein